MKMKARNLMMALIALCGSWMPQLTEARVQSAVTPGPSVKSRKIARDSRIHESARPVREEMVPVTTYVQPSLPTSGIAANSYLPAPRPVTQYVYQAPVQPEQPNLMLTMAPALAQAMMALMQDSGGKSKTSSSTPVFVNDPTAGMTESQVTASAYTSAPPDSVEDLRASSHDDDVIVQLPGASPSRAISERGHLHSMKYDAETAMGQCLAPVKTVGEARRILVRNGIQVGRETNEHQLVSLAMGIQQLELLSGGKAKFVDGAVFRFLKNSRHSSQRSNGIYMGANHQDGNVNHLMHELGHFAGNKGLYEGYKRLARCNLSNYSHKNWSAGTARNEEFAEVFAAFVGSPGRLRDSGNKACRDAFDYLSQHYPQARQYAICDRATLVAALGDRSGIRAAALERRPADDQKAVR